MSKAAHFILLLLSVVTTSSLAQSYNQEEIQLLAEKHVESIFPADSKEIIKAKASPIDNRKKINPCEKQLSLTTPNLSQFSRNVTVRIRCLDKKGWSLYIPVKVGIMTPVVVAYNTIEKGDIVSSGNAKVALIDKSYARKNQITRLNLVMGSKSKRQIRPGQAILNNNLCFVCKGDMVTMQAIAKGLTVKASGKALSDGSYGDVISIKNSKSKRVVQGRVVAVGKVEISL